MKGRLPIRRVFVARSLLQYGWERYRVFVAKQRRQPGWLVEFLTACK